MTRRVLVAVVPALALMVMGWSWAFASPVGSSADEPFHLTSSWCAWGDHEDCIRNEVEGTARVPQQVAESNCFAGQWRLNARCTWLLTDELVITGKVNPPTGVYPPVFYGTMRAFVGPDVARSVLMMRLANVGLAAVLLAVLLWAAPPVIRRAVAVVWMVTVIPVGIFFIASVNPSSWAITGVGLFWAFLWSWVRLDPWRSARAWIALGGAGVTAVMAIGARSDSALAVGLSAVAVAILEWRRLRARIPLRVMAAVGAGVAVMPVAAAWVFHVGDYLSRFTASFPPGNASADQPNPLLKTLLELPAFVAGVFGGQQPWTMRESENDWAQEGYGWHGFTYGVGSVDVVNPSIAAVLAGACVAGVVFLGIGRMSRRKLVVVLGLGVVFLAQVVLMRALVDFGAMWSNGVQWALQPRYYLPLAMIVVAFAVVCFPASRPFMSRTQAVGLAAFMSLAAASSLAATTSRFVHGQDHSWVQFTPETGWWWSWGPSPSALVIMGALAGVVYMASMAGIARQAPSQPDDAITLEPTPRVEA